MRTIAYLPQILCPASASLSVLSQTMLSGVSLSVVAAVLSDLLATAQSF